MAKNMARIENGVVVNIEWCSDKEPETDTLKNCNDRSICIGDVFIDGKFYRNGEEVPTDLEAARRTIEALTDQNFELANTIAQMVEAVYAQGNT